MSRIPVSVFLITKNEADRLGRSLEAVAGFADEIIVVDSGSDDRTCEIAESFGAKVIQNVPFPGYGEQKRFAEKQCRNDWVLNIDADEVVSDQLRAEIEHLLGSDMDPHVGYEIRIIDMLPSETFPSVFAYSLYPVRLYNLKYGRYNPSMVHDRVDMGQQTRTVRLSGAILHYSVRSLGKQMEKLLKYAVLQANEYYDSRRKLSRLRIFFEFPHAFLKSYIFRKYIFRGTFGFLISINYAYYRTIRIAMIYEKILLNK